MRRLPLAVAVAAMLLLSTVPGATQPTSSPTPQPEQGPPPTPVPPFGSPSPFPTTLATPEPHRSLPQLSAAGWALIEMDEGEELLVNQTEARPVASLTKIMTALVVIEEASKREVVTVSDLAAAQGGAELGLEPGERLQVRHLLFAMLLQSANDAAVALAEHVAGSAEDFVYLMNLKGADLGLVATIFQSPTGLVDSGISTPTDLARLMIAASQKALFRRIVATKVYEVPAREGEPRMIQNRNVLLWLYPGATGGKTGFTSAAGYSVVATAEREGLRLVAVVLGAPGEAFSGAATLLNYGFATFERRAIIKTGERFQVLVLGLPVTVSAAHGLDALVKQTEDLDVQIIVEEGLRFPVNEGERIAKAVVSRAGERIGSVPLEAASDSTLETTVLRSWLRSAWEALAAAFDWFIGIFS